MVQVHCDDIPSSDDVAESNICEQENDPERLPIFVGALNITIITNPKIDIN